MSETSSRSSEVEVSVDPGTAFTAFTDELDLWWVRGPINSYGAGKLVAMRCEQGIGGRLLEVYDEATGEGLELARITAWEPGKHLAWQSSLDDVMIDVRFDPTENGTVVRLRATIPEGGSDKGGSAFIRVTPRWFRTWVAKRDTTPHELHDLARFALTLHYARPAAAARWLAAVFGFESPDAVPAEEDALDEGDDEHPWIEFHVGNCSLMIDKLVGQPVDHRQVTHVPWVFVDDLDAHLVRSRDHGATIVEGITSHGFRSYVALDIEGRRWRFAEARPTQPG
ncbi:MAG: bleomycin resistance protein [Chloroflexi bacterium]|nr:bleomycin resistance protein [Chloroflexota bacterium]